MKKNLKILFLMGIFVFLSLTIFISNIFDDLDFNYKNRLETSGVWVLTSTIYIDDLNPNYNWSRIVADNDWCSGSGTWSDPYLIENVTINSLLLGSCIYIENSNAFFIIRNCTLVNIGHGADPNYDSGIRLDNVSNGIMMSNNCSSNYGNGIYFRDCNNLTISSNIANNNGHVGIYVYTSNNNTIEDNEIKNCEVNLYIYEGNNNKFIGNTISQPIYSLSDNLDREIELTGYNNSFSGNIMNNCGIHLREETILNKISSHKIDSTNLVNGKPIYYYVQEQFLKKENFSNAGQIILVDCDHSEIPNVNISNGACGISLFYCNNITIFNSSITYQYRYGILLYHSNNNNISQNSLLNIRSLYAMYLRYSNNNNISSNRISTYSYATGIDLMTCYWNTIRNNLINDCYPGIDMWSNDNAQLNNIFEDNIISNNSWYGIRLGNDRSKGNIFYLNKFINNEENCEDNGQINYWDNGSIGNYWDDYNGNDTNDNGIGDTPYTMLGSGGNQDNYPIWDDGHNGSKIVIDESASNNWESATQYTWCSGSGTKEDPYVITGANIDGQNSSSCIYIKNSNAYFIIKDSTTYNASGANFPTCAGIELEDTNNGLLLNNNCSNNNGYGILIEQYNFGCNNITIRDCIINNNGMMQIFSIKAGIFVDRSHNTTIINNTFNNNDRGIFLSNSHDNKIIENNFNINWNQAVRVSQSNLNLIKRNYINGSTYGILLNANNNTVSFNEISFNSYRGIYLAGSNFYNTIANNSIYNNTGGIYLDSGQCQNNLFYNNSLIGNDNNAFDDGVFNDWDNGIIGNYWDDYTGEDGDDDGIGEDPYIITGLATSQDNFPIWDDGHNGSKIVIDNGASNNWDWAKTRIWCTGSGTFNDPYIIKDCIIDGKNLTSCIEISNSMVYFRINNCSLFNSSSSLNNAGIELKNVINGQLVNNNCSNNNGNGILLSNSDNNTISGNIANKNSEFGILLSASHNNTLSGNILNENFYGLYLGLSNNNTISENSAYNNDWQGIYLSSSSNNNTILNNNLTYNNDNGILIDSSNYNKLFGNIADNNGWNGILLWDSNNNTIRGNLIRYNVFAGVYLYRSNNTDVIENNFIGNLYSIYDVECINNNFILNFYDGMLSPFVIDNNGGGDLTWLEAVDLFIWCTGSGTYSDPYIIQNLIIDGQNSSSCIEISDSIVFFKIEGCTLYNSGAGIYNAGIKLTNVINGQLINNNCSNNNGVGIGLYQSQNVTIGGNFVNNNDEFGIFLEGSHNNTLSGNTLNENSNGIYLGLSNNNTISENSAFNNDLRGMYLSTSSNNNTIMSNNVTYNGDNGIDIYDSHDIKIVGNIADYNGLNGIFVWKNNNTTVVRNIANYNTFAGLYLWVSNKTEVIGNVFIGNSYNIFKSGGENNILNWNVENGFTTSIIIDDSGTGNFTWVETVNKLAWIYGSGTLIDPYIIELITINGLNLTSCLTIRNSIVYFKIQNCTFYNSGSNFYDGGIKLISVSNGELIHNNCSFNNANGIVLDSCQNILIKENTINNNMLSGISVINSNNIDIINNKATINYNGEYGILLENSDDNEISNNIINFNQIGIYLINSNDNLIAFNDLQFNILEAYHIESGLGNILDGNLLPREPSEFPLEILILILIIGIVAVGITGSAFIIKKRISSSRLKEKKEVSEKKREKIRNKLEGKLEFVDYLIRERNIKIAYKNLGKIKDTAEMYEFFDIFNKASEKVETCKEIEKMPPPVIKEEVSKTTKKVETKEAVMAPPVIKREEGKKLNLFISYSTADRDYFQIEKIVTELKKYPNVNLISYWERDSKANIVEYMDKTLEVSNTFILFCSENSLKSNAVKDEWQAAFQMRKEGLIKLIPIYEDQKHIPKILWHLLNVKYEKDDFKGFIENLYKEMLRD